jgi:hypothetical protein
LPKTLKLCLAHLVAFLRVVICANREEEERLELERAQQITRNASRWMPSNMTKSLKLDQTGKKKMVDPPKIKPIDQKSRVAQEFVHLRDPSSLYKARAPTTIAELETILRDSLQALCKKHDDPLLNQQLCEDEIEQAMLTRQNRSNNVFSNSKKKTSNEFVLDFQTCKTKCERLLSCAGALLSKQIRSVADEAIDSICQFFRKSIVQGQDSTRTAHSRGGGALPRQVTNAQLVAACVYHMSGNDNDSSGRSRFGQGLELFDAKPVFSIIQLEVNMSVGGGGGGAITVNTEAATDSAHGAAVEPNRTNRTSATPLLVPTITPSRSILLQTSYHCIDSIVKAVADFPRYDINTLITHHMDNWDRNFSRSQRSSQCRSPRSETQAIPPTALTLSSSSIQIDHPAVVEAKLIIKHCIDTTYDDVAGILPTIKSFCYVFHSDQDALAKKMVSECIQTLFLLQYVSFFD